MFISLKVNKTYLDYQKFAVESSEMRGKKIALIPLVTSRIFIKTFKLIFQENQSKFKKRKKKHTLKTTMYNVIVLKKNK